MVNALELVSGFTTLNIGYFIFSSHGGGIFGSRILALFVATFVIHVLAS